MVAQNMAAQGRCLLCLMLSELVLFRTGCMIVARHVINCGEREAGSYSGGKQRSVFLNANSHCTIIKLGDRAVAAI